MKFRDISLTTIVRMVYGLGGFPVLSGYLEAYESSSSSFKSSKEV